MTRRSPEADLQEDVVTYLRYALPVEAVFHHSPNEGKRGWQAQRDIKRMGVQAGWPDLEIFYGGLVHFIELKFGKAKLSAVQEALHARLDDEEWTVSVCRSVDDVERALAWIPMKARLQ